MQDLYKHSEHDYVVEKIKVIDFDDADARVAFREMEVKGDGTVSSLYGSNAITFMTEDRFDEVFVEYRPKLGHGLYVAEDQHGLSNYFLVNDQWDREEAYVWRLADDGYPTYYMSFRKWEERHGYKNFRKATTMGGNELKLN